MNSLAECLLQTIAPVFDNQSSNDAAVDSETAAER